MSSSPVSCRRRPSLRRALYQDDQRRMRGRSCAPSYRRCDSSEDICRARNFNWQNSQSDYVSLSEVLSCLYRRAFGDQRLPIAEGCSSRLRTVVVWLSDITTISKGVCGACSPVTPYNSLNTKKGRPVRVYCKNYHVVTALRLAVLTARCVAQKGYNPSLFYRALIH
jgi:hypothetical protein